jgi:hypothetical protein
VSKIVEMGWTVKIDWSVNQCHHTVTAHRMLPVNMSALDVLRNVADASRVDFNDITGVEVKHNGSYVSEVEEPAK